MPSVATMYNPPLRKEVISITYGEKKSYDNLSRFVFRVFYFVIMKLDGVRLL